MKTSDGSTGLPTRSRRAPAMPHEWPRAPGAARPSSRTKYWGWQDWYTSLAKPTPQLSPEAERLKRLEEENLWLRQQVAAMAADKYLSGPVEPHHEKKKPLTRLARRGSFSRK